MTNPIPSQGHAHLHRLQRSAAASPPPPAAAEQPAAAEDWGSAPAPVADRHSATGERSGRALSTVGLVTSLANAGTSGAYEINRLQNRSNSLAATLPKNGTGTPNQYRLGLIDNLKATNGSISKLNEEKAPFQAFLRGKGDLTAKQISSTMSQEKRYWQNELSSAESSARYHRSEANRIESQIPWVTDTKDSDGNVTESAWSKRRSLETDVSSHRSAAAACDETASLSKVRLKRVDSYIAGRTKDPEILKAAVSRRVDNAKSKINTLEGEASSLATKIKREPFRETMMQKGGRAAIGVMSAAGAVLEGMSAQRSFAKGNDAGGYLHSAAAVGHAILATGTFLRSPAGAVTGATLATLGSIGGAIADEQ